MEGHGLQETEGCEPERVGRVRDEVRTPRVSPAPLSRTGLYPLIAHLWMDEVIGPMIQSHH